MKKSIQLSYFLCIGCSLAQLTVEASEVNTQRSTSGEKRPNILFILSDDHTSQAWGVYGGILAPYVKNENIRRLAAEGCVLDNCFCTNSISVPSRASILTGRYSHKNQVYTLADSLPVALPTIATTLQSGGYQTGLVGKWHLKSQPQGFDYYSVFYDQGEYVDPTFLNSDEPWRSDKNFGERVHGFSTDIVTNKAIQWMKQRDTNQPFMLCCHFKATHEPYDFPWRMKHLYDGVTFPEPATLMDFDRTANGRTFDGQPLETIARNWQWASKDPDKWWCRYPELPFSTENLSKEAARKVTYQKLMRDYLRCGATIDDNMGRLLRFLDEQGLTENTIVIYVSDQGYFLGEHGFYDKRIFYEESARMPFVIRYPCEIPAGKRLSDLILNVDFASLLCDYAGQVAPEGSQGSSFRANLRGTTPQEWRKSIYYRYWTQHDIRPAHIGVRTERYKLIFFYGHKLHTQGSADTVTSPAWEFYDLLHDPNEQHNAYADRQYASVIRDMKRELVKLRNETEDTDVDSPTMQQILKQSGL